MNAEIDDAVRATYAAQCQSADEILCDPETASAFGRSVANVLASPVEIPHVLKRLMALRKRGAAKGGLPRKPR